MHQVAAQERWEEVGEISPGLDFAAQPGEAAALDGADHQLARLVRAIEAEIVPRLVLACRGVQHPPPIAVADPLTPTAAEVADFTDIALTSDAGTAFAHVDAMRGRGMSLATLFLHLLTPAARRLGDLWSEDLCDFTQVTVALWRLHQVLRHLSPAAPDDPDGRNVDRRALLVPMPGEQHSFGIAMVAEFFRQGGWNVWSGPLAATDDLLAIVRSDWFAVIGVSVSSVTTLDSVGELIRAIRRASRNRAVGVMVGGQVFNSHPDLVARVGADATAADGRHATAQAEGLLALLPQDAPHRRSAAHGTARGERP
jgi:methanogenic corrinoid protein MtbC1